MNARIAASVAAALLCASAHADVVYNWQPQSAPAPFVASTGRLVLDDAAWQSGAIRYTYAGRDATSPVIDFGFTFPLPAGPALSTIDSRPREGVGFGGPGTRQRWDLTIGTDGALSGNIQYLSADVQFALSGSGLWSIANVGTEFASACNPRACQDTGVTGRWVLDAATMPGAGGTAQVSLPGTLPLMALASFGIAAAMRRRA